MPLNRYGLEKHQGIGEGEPAVIVSPTVDKCGGDRGRQAVGGYPIPAVGAHCGQPRTGIQVQIAQSFR